MRVEVHSNSGIGSIPTILRALEEVFAGQSVEASAVTDGLLAVPFGIFGAAERLHQNVVRQTDRQLHISLFVKLQWKEVPLGLHTILRISLDSRRKEAVP
jgi:hypothetical protein